MNITVLLLPVFVFLSCRSESLFNRLAEGYLPYDKINSSWMFKVTGTDTLTVEWTVKANEPFNGRDASLVESTEGDFYYALAPEALLEFVSHTIFSFGEELVLEARWRPRVERPLNLGNRWEDAFTNQVVHQGVTYSIESNLVGVVEGLETVFTPADFFEECYRVNIDIRTRIVLPTGDIEEESRTVTEWYAPGVGMVKREVAGGELWELTDFFVF